MPLQPEVPAGFTRPIISGAPVPSYSPHARSTTAPGAAPPYPPRSGRPYTARSRTALPRQAGRAHRSFGPPRSQRPLDLGRHSSAAPTAPWERALCVVEPQSSEQAQSGFFEVLDGEEVSDTSTRSAAAAGLSGSLMAAVVLCAAGGTAATALADQHNPTITPLTQTGVPVDVQSAAAPRSVTVGSVDAQRNRTSAGASSRDELTSVMRELAQPDRARPSEPPVPQRPRSAAPTYGTVTSSYGARWSTTHYGLDIANTIGTPVVSTSDGQVIESGPADGFGLWIRVLQDDGTIGVYGHINETLVSVGQRVQAGEQIATVGNRGYSTGPHLHYEVWQQDGPKLDPAQWLRTRGVYVVG